MHSQEHPSKGTVLVKLNYTVIKLNWQAVSHQLSKVTTMSGSKVLTRIHKLRVC